MNKFITIFFVLFCCCKLSEVYGKGKDSVVVITITDTNRIRKMKEQRGEVYVNPANKVSKEDSSRFVKRKQKSTETTASK